LLSIARGRGRTARVGKKPNDGSGNLTGIQAEKQKSKRRLPERRGQRVGLGGKGDQDLKANQPKGGVQGVTGCHVRPSSHTNEKSLPGGAPDWEAGGKPWGKKIKMGKELSVGKGLGVSKWGRTVGTWAEPQEREHPSSTPLPKPQRASIRKKKPETQNRGHPRARDGWPHRCANEHKGLRRGEHLTKDGGTGENAMKQAGEHNKGKREETVFCRVGMRQSSGRAMSMEGKGKKTNTKKKSRKKKMHTPQRYGGHTRGKEEIFGRVEHTRTLGHRRMNKSRSWNKNHGPRPVKRGKGRPKKQTGGQKLEWQLWTGGRFEERILQGRQK